MKKTFLIGLPRCGSLAMSVYNNNDYCIAHHEGLDFSLRKDAAYDESYSSILMEKARREGKNYFCCDISMHHHLIRKYIRSRVALGIDPYGDIQIIHSVTTVDQSTESVCRLFGCDEIAKKALHAILSNMEKANRELLYILKEQQVPMLKISDPSNYQEIGAFVGSWNEKDPLSNRRMRYLSECRYTTTAHQLHRGGLEMQKSGWL